MNILFVRLSYIGDILHATAAARWIKQQYPHAILHWIVTPSMAELLENNPYVDVIIPWARDEYEAHSKKLHVGAMWSMWWQLRKQLETYHFDVAIDVQGRLITGLVLLASGAPLRLGLSGTKELNWLFTNRKTNSTTTHVIERYIEVAQLLAQEFPLMMNVSDAESTKKSIHFLAPSQEFIGTECNQNSMDFFVTPQESLDAKAALDAHFIDSTKPRIGLVLGTSWASKAWPAHKWQQLVESMNYRADFVCFGGEKEAGEYESFLTSQVAIGSNLYNCSGKTSLRQMAALIAECDVVVACDTGGLHMAIALEKPVVALFGPTDPMEWGPITGNYRILQNKNVPCLGCKKRQCPKEKTYCMTGIDSIKVKEAIIQLLSYNI